MNNFTAHGIATITVLITVTILLAVAA